MTDESQHETQVNVSMNLPESLLHQIDREIKNELARTGVKLYRNQFVARAVRAWVDGKKAE